MRLIARAISNKVFLLALISNLVLASCASAPALESNKKTKTKLANLKVFYASFDNVWRAAQLALKYPIAVNNMDNGVLETDYIKADDGFVSPTDQKVISSGVRYKITMILAKGKVDGRDSVRVTINKTIEKKRDFFADPEPLPSHGVEELILFYRMDRELTIDEALKRAAKTNP